MKKNIERMMTIILLAAMLAGCAPATPAPKVYTPPNTISAENQRQTTEMSGKILFEEQILNSALHGDYPVDKQIEVTQKFSENLALLLAAYPDADQNLREYTLDTSKLFADYSTFLEKNKDKLQMQISGLVASLITAVIVAKYGGAEAGQQAGEDVAEEGMQQANELGAEEARLAVEMKQWYSETSRLFAYLAQTYSLASAPESQPQVNEPDLEPTSDAAETPKSQKTPKPKPTKKPSISNPVITISNCDLFIGQSVQLMADTRFWSKPDVNEGDFTSAETGVQVFILGSPVKGAIHFNTNDAGWWWEVGKKNGKSLGWVWEQKFAECH